MQIVWIKEDHLDAIEDANDNNSYYGARRGAGPKERGAVNAGEPSIRRFCKNKKAILPKGSIKDLG